MRRVGTAVAVAVTLLTASGCNDALIDTRSCTFVDAPQVDRSCDVDDVRGTVIGKTSASKAGNPSVRVDTRVGEVRVFMKLEFWKTYHVGEPYP